MPAEIASSPECIFNPEFGARILFNPNSFHPQCPSLCIFTNNNTKLSLTATEREESRQDAGYNPHDNTREAEIRDLPVSVLP